MKTKNLIALSLIGVSAVALVACNDDETVVIKDDVKEEVDSDKATKEAELNKYDANGFDEKVFKDISSVIEENAINMVDENLDSYLEDVIYTAENEELVVSSVTSIFEMLDATYELENIKLLELTDTTANVQVTQVTKATKVQEGIQFNDNRSVAVHNLVFQDGRWKFSESSVLSVNYLDKNGKEMAEPEKTVAK